MIAINKHIPVLIVGGGPVGLFLGISLLKKGINCRIIEQRKKVVPDSRSLGIHPVSLELFDELDIVSSFLQKGLPIKKGIALSDTKELGTISFHSCKKPYNYILSCPQFFTETILRKELKKLNADVLITGTTFKAFREHPNNITTHYSTSEGNNHMLKSQFLVGCDGKNSAVRQHASIHYSGKRYPDTYIMGDFKDTTDFKHKAAVFLPPAGLIECFPLPNGMRRWVAKTDRYIPHPNKQLLADIIEKRIGYSLHNTKHVMLSSFGVQHYMAETLTKNNLFLAGDAAHVVSPIGGQGMNLGWIGAAKLAAILSSVLSGRSTPSRIADASSTYTTTQTRLANKVGRRAEINMRLGRKTSVPFIRNGIVRLMLSAAFNAKTAQFFTMRGLKQGWL
ncbi:MAG: FAD-dependent monooxygenase [Balneolaceae bacterium]|nr:FAD-dependent monooxygenase [Balneolaceae bacterium]